MSKLQYLRASILYFTQDPYNLQNQEDSCVFHEDGLIIVNQETGLIVDSGDFQEMQQKHQVQEEQISEEFRGKLIMPGFIDCHTHYPQTEMMSAYSQSLVQWLNEYTFPTEGQFGDYEYAREISKFYLQQLLRAGTTSALVFSTVHKQSVEAIFDEALKLNMRILSGKTLMDRNAPDYLLDTPELAYKESEELIQKYCGKGRLLYSITPRFAPTSTQAQLDVVGELKKKYPESWIHTHLNENLQEIDWVKDLFPESKSYLHVYKDSNMMHKRSVFAHCCHCNQDDYNELRESQAGVAFCPSSNGFLGAGIFDYHEAVKQDMNFGIGTDIGAGTDFSILRTLQDGYKFIMLRQQNIGDRRPMSSFEGLYRATLGGAKALSIDDKVGKLCQGYEADFVVMEWNVDQIQHLRTQCLYKTQSSMYAKNGEGSEFKLQEKLFGLMMLGSNANVFATFIAGIEQYRNQELVQNIKNNSQQLQFKAVSQQNNVQA